MKALSPPQILAGMPIRLLPWWEPGAGLCTALGAFPLNGSRSAVSRLEEVFHHLKKWIFGKLRRNWFK